MSHKMHGIKEVYLAPGSGVFPPTGTGAFGCGYDGKGALVISPHNPSKGEKGKQFLTYLNHQVKKKTNQFGFSFMKFLLTAVQANDITAKVITSGVTKPEDFTASGGLFTYENAKSLGIDFEMELSNTDAFISLTLEKAYTKASSEAIITASTTDTLPGELNLPMLDAAGLAIGGITPAFGTVTIAEDRLSTFKINLKSVFTKNGMNKSLASRMSVTIEGVMSGPDPAEMASILSFEIAPEISVTVPVASPYEIIFEAGGLSKVGDVTIDDDKREGKIMLQGEYDLDFLDMSGSDIVFKAKL